MSRSHSYSSSHSHRGRSRGNSSLSVTEASFQSLRVSEPPSSDRSPRSSAFQAPDNRDPRSTYRQGDLALQYLQVGYNPANVAPTSPSARAGDSSRLSPSLLALEQDNLGYIDPTTAFNTPDMRYDVSVQVPSSHRVDFGLSSYAFSHGPMESPYRAGDTSPYVASRSSSSMRGS